jgi:hypothetical protein
MNYESLKEWGSIRVLIFLCLSNLSKSKIPKFFGVPLCMWGKLIENEFHLLLNFYNIGHELTIHEKVVC